MTITIVYERYIYMYEQHISTVSLIGAFSFIIIVIHVHYKCIVTMVIFMNTIITNDE